MSILRSIYTIFFTVVSRNSTKISNFKNKKMMTNELLSFDEFNAISTCLDNTIRFLSQLSKKMKTPIRFLSQLSKNENSLGNKYLLPREKMLYFCHDVDIREVDFYSRIVKKSNYVSSIF
jgi:hypothetical protein